MLFQVFFDCFEFGFEFFKCHLEYITLISILPKLYFFLQYSLANIINGRSIFRRLL